MWLLNKGRKPPTSPLTAFFFFTPAWSQVTQLPHIRAGLAHSQGVGKRLQILLPPSTPDIHLLEQGTKPIAAQPFIATTVLLKQTSSVLHRLAVWKCIKQDSFCICTACLLADFLKAVWLMQQIWMWVYQLHWMDCTDGLLSAYFKLGVCSY